MTTMTTTSTEGAELNQEIHFITKVRTNIESFGRQWTSAGLYAGKSALERSADNLRTAAEYLGDLAAKLQEEAEAAATAEAAGSDDAEAKAAPEAGAEATTEAAPEAAADGGPAATGDAASAAN